MPFIMHEGVKRRSGRYPWGTGETPYQHESWFRWGEYEEYKKEGLSETEIARRMGYESASELRANVSMASDERRQYRKHQAAELYAKQWSYSAIARELGVSEGTVRNWLKNTDNEREKMTNLTADILRESVDSKGYIDVGKGIANYMGVSETKMRTALTKLKEEGYEVINIQVDQLAGDPNQKTTIKVLCPPGTTYASLMKEVTFGKENVIKLPDVQGLQDFSDTAEERIKNKLGLETPRSVDSSRIAIRYGDEGGESMDGVIELRRGVDYISLGDNNYAQVRIMVDGTHYIKGMAIYSDDLPEGVDIRFNTNKSSGTPMMDADPDAKQVLKPISSDPDNPFGAIVRQRHYVDIDGKDQLSAINICSEEGDWSEWKNTLASQFLSKQSPELIQRQLSTFYENKKAEFDDILQTTNPVVKKLLLEKFSDKADSDAVHLDAAGLPRQAWHAILPINSLKETEVYAPNYRDGEKVVLIRYPHGGKFEIPELTVNNKNPEGKMIISNSPDAVGINSKVAQQLSGADFDGDTVLVIPNRDPANPSKPIISVDKYPTSLANFNPKELYSLPPEAPRISSEQKQTEMGKVSNLITDMTIKGAPIDEIIRAVKHSMVVIDSEKHHLDYKKSEEDFGIKELKIKYQGVNEKTGQPKGASTIISRSTAEVYVPDRKEIKYPSKMTDEEKDAYISGKKVYRDTGKVLTFKDKTPSGDVKVVTKVKQDKITQGEKVSDAYELSSGTYKEALYAEHSNQLRALADEARAILRSTPDPKINASARKVYKEQVDSLNAKLQIAVKNKPLERQAQLLANKVVTSKKQENPALKKDKKALKKIKTQALAMAREQVSVTSRKERTINITQKEWEAIQAGAVSSNLLRQILDNADLDQVRAYSMPKTTTGMSDSKLSRARSMADRGYTQAQIADALGVSVSTINKVLSNS